MQNHFELLDLPQRFAIDEAALAAAYRTLQNQVHPDKFASASDAEKRVALQWATRTNEAYQTLRSPLKRAAYLCELRGADLQTESNTSMAPAFLMQQMEWREALDEARAAADLTALERLQAEAKQARNAMLQGIEQVLDVTPDLVKATTEVRQLMFLEKFVSEIDEAFERIEA